MVEIFGDRRVGIALAIADLSLVGNRLFPEGIKGSLDILMILVPQDTRWHLPATGYDFIFRRAGGAMAPRRKEELSGTRAWTLNSSAPPSIRVVGRRWSLLAFLGFEMTSMRPPRTFHALRLC